MKIYYEVGMDEIPKSCLDCACHWCNYPLRQNCYEPTVKVKYRKQRHENCPLKIEE